MGGAFGGAGNGGDEIRNEARNEIALARVVGAAVRGVLHGAHGERRMGEAPFERGRRAGGNLVVIFGPERERGAGDGGQAGAQAADQPVQIDQLAGGKALVQLPVGELAPAPLDIGLRVPDGGEERAEQTRGVEIGAHADGRADQAQPGAVAPGGDQTGEDSAERQADRNDARAAGRAQPVIALERAGKPLLAGRVLQVADGRSVAGQQRGIHGAAARRKRIGHDAHVCRRAADAVEHKAADRILAGVEVRVAQSIECGRRIENAVVERKAGQFQSSFLVCR